MFAYLKPLLFKIRGVGSRGTPGLGSSHLRPSQTLTATSVLGHTRPVVTLVTQERYRVACVNW